MKGHIKKRSKGSWSIWVEMGRDAAGRRRQKTFTVKGSRKDAERELTHILNEINTGEFVEPSKMTLSDYLERWLKDYAKPRVSPKTYERYKQIVDGELVPALGNLVLSKLRPLQIQAFYADRLDQGRKDGRGGLSPQTVLHYHRLLHKALDQAVKWQMLARNPASAVEPPKPQREQMRALDQIETTTLLRLVEGSRLYIPVLLAVTGGLRRGEILALRWQDLDLKTGRATIARSLEQTADGLRVKSPKTERGRRTVVFPGYTLDALKAHKKEQAERKLATGPVYQNSGLVCARADGSEWPPDTFSTAFAALVRRSNLAHFRFHDLRHTHATQLLKQGVHPKIVSERLGHSNIGITLDTYSHVLPGMQEDAVLSFDACFRNMIASDNGAQSRD